MSDRAPQSMIVSYAVYSHMNVINTSNTSMIMNEAEDSDDVVVQKI